MSGSVATTHATEEVEMAEQVTTAQLAHVQRIAYDQAEFAVMIGSTPQAVRRKVARGRIPTVRIGGRRLIPAAYVEAIRSGELDGEGGAG